MSDPYNLNPLGISPDQAQIEEVQSNTVQSSQAPNQAISISVRNMADLVQFDQKEI